MADSPLTCVIEIPKGRRNKYEQDPELGAIKLDRFISASVLYPTDYGYVPGTLAPDGDPLDALVCVSEPTFPGCTVLANPVGLFKMSDEKGPDDHVVCVPCDDPGWSEVRDVKRAARAARRVRDSGAAEAAWLRTSRRFDRQRRCPRRPLPAPCQVPASA